MTQYQNYRHYKLPITINPLEYGKLIFKTDNISIIHVRVRTIAVITQFEDFNEVKFFKDGDLAFIYKDHKIDDSTFIRSIDNSKFTFKNNKLVNIDKTTTIRTVILNKLHFTNSVSLAKLNYRDTNSIMINKLGIRRFSKNFIKLRKVTSQNIWNTLDFKINNKIFTKVLFEKIFNKFWGEISYLFNSDNHMYILFKIKYTNNEIVTIGNLQRLSLNDKDWYINWIINNMDFKSEYYNETQIDSFHISYGFKNVKIKDKNIVNPELNFQNYKNNKLVISFNPLDFGKILSKTFDGNETIYILLTKENFIIKIINSVNKNIIEILKGVDVIMKFQDFKLNDSRFVRIIDNKKFYFENNKEILFTKEINSKSISKLAKSKNLIHNFITLDIETYIKGNILIPFCISIYDGKGTNSFFLSDYKNSSEMLLSALKSIMIRKYNGFNIYIHNMAKFDIIFLMKYLVKLCHVNPIIHNNRIISINLNYGKNNEYTLHFKDSYLLLLASLGKLCKSFNVETQKSIFPYLFINEKNLDYIGSVPDFKFFDNKINLAEYNKYKHIFNYNNWNLKKEAIKYCEIDCISLYQVIFKFSELIFSYFGKNIHRYPTLPSLAFAIFRSNFMVKNTIPQLCGKIAKDIRLGYTGGAVDMYIPQPPEGVKLKCYDVNSLYPSVMKNCPMPVGKPTYFEGDIRKVDSKAFGFFWCEIIAPDNIKHPIIQTHVKTNSGIRTISPLGTWDDMIFSAEMDNAIKYGYKFNILWGYTFEKAYIFNDYVDFLYNFRLNYPKSDPLNYIAKILLNSLYGRFGMDDNFTEVIIIHKDYLADFENKYFENIISKTELDDYVLVEIKNPAILENDQDSTHNINVSIAAAITAYARIHMSQFKNNPKINLYYTDTDSIYTDSDLDEDFLSETVLGKLKLENICSKAVFLSPKVYCLETEDGKFIYKVKGLKHEVKLTKTDFETLLYKDVLLEKSQTKWMRDLSEGQIKLLEQVYTLKVTDNKRELIYDENNKLISTKAYKINKSKDITL